MEKIAILIPTKDRLDFIIRAIKYYVAINSPHPIFIADASSDSSEELVLNAANDNIEVYYFHWENLKIRKSLIKLAEKANQANITNYCAYHGDDDFFISKSLSMCAEFLDKNPSYATAQGRAFTLRLIQDSPYGDLADVCIYWDVKELNGDTALDRLKEISADYWVPIFSVHRINEFIDDISNGVDSILDRNLGEYSNSLSIAMRGKSKFIDCLYLTRGIHSGIEHKTRFEWVTGENWYLSYSNLKSLISSELLKYDNLSLIDSNNEVKLALERILPFEDNFLFSKRYFLKKIYANLIEKRGIVFMLSKLYRRIKFISIFPNNNFSQASLLSTKSKYYKDVSFIINFCKRD